MEVARYADRIVSIVDGRIRADAGAAVPVEA